MSRLGQQALALHQQTKLPSGPSLLARSFVNNHTVEQSSSTNKLDEGRVELGEFRSEDFTELEGSVGEVLLDKNVEGSHGNSATKRVTAVGRTVLSRLNAKHNILVGEDTRDGVHYIDRSADDRWIEDTADTYYHQKGLCRE